MLTARTDESDRVLGLDLGADDYVSKPFSVRELLARVRAQLRREGIIGEPDDSEFVIGDIRVNLRTRSVTRRNRHLELSPHEFELLRYLIAHRGEVVSREQLLRDVWGYSQLSVTRTVDNYIFRLRNHVEPRPHDPRFILTVHGSGSVSWSERGSACPERASGHARVEGRQKQFRDGSRRKRITHRAAKAPRMNPLPRGTRS